MPHEEPTNRPLTSVIDRRKFLSTGSQAILGGVTVVGLGAVLDACGSTSTGPAAPPKKAALVSTQKAGDKGPVDDMVASLAKAKGDFNLTTKFIEAPDPSSYEATLRNLATANYDVVATTFNEMSKPISAVAPQFPKTRFVQIFGDPFDPPLANVTTISYDYYLGTYLSGLFCGGASRTGKLGYIGGLSIPPLNADFNSYKAASQSVKAAIKATPAFAGSFEDPAKGHELAAAMYSSGIDFIQTDAAATDLGIIDAANEKGGFVIGGAPAVYSRGPKSVAGIVFLRFGKSLYDQIKNALSSGYKGGHVHSGLNDDIVGLAFSDTFLAQGPSDIVAKINGSKAMLEKARADIISGAVKVPFTTTL